MMNLYEQGFGGCLADDMGLGKTLQTLTLLQKITAAIDDSDTEREKTELPKNKSGISVEYERNPILKSEPVRIDEMGQFELFGDLTKENTLNKCEVSQRTAETTRKPSTLIVVPTSLLHNWKREAARFTTLSMAEYNSNSHYKEGHPDAIFQSFSSDIHLLRCPSGINSMFSGNTVSSTSYWTKARISRIVIH